MDKIENTILIKAAPNMVWRALTEPEMMKQWMGDAEMKIRIVTDWTIGKPITITGFHHIHFKNSGNILAFNVEEKVSYSHLSSLSRLSNEIKHYSIITFLLLKIEEGTRLTLRLENFPTESIYRHLNFYWRGTLSHLKTYIENDLTT